MNVRDYLSIPYILEAQAIERGDGWTRRLRYPELGDVEAVHDDVEQAFLAVERKRLKEIVRRLQAGDPPPVPRPPLETTDQRWWAGFLGLGDLIEGLIDLPADDLAGMDKVGRH